MFYHILTVTVSLVCVATNWRCPEDGQWIVFGTKIKMSWKKSCHEIEQGEGMPGDGGHNTLYENLLWIGTVYSLVKPCT